MQLFSCARSVLFAATVAASNFIPSARALTTEELNADLVATPASPGYNVDGKSVFTNFVTANNDEQFFLIVDVMVLFEKPSSDAVKGSVLYWCSDLSFTGVQNSSSSPGYASRCVGMKLGSFLADILAEGSQQTEMSASASTKDFATTYGVSAVFVEQLNVFQGQLHKNSDDFVFRYWDDGRPTMSSIAWEGHDEGDKNPNAASSAFSNVAEFTWTSVEDVAKLFNTTTDKFTPDTFKDVYASTWIKEHEEEAENNPNPDAELAIIDQVKNETDGNGNNGGTGETDEPASTTTNIGNTDTDVNNGAAGSPAEDNDDTSTGTGRQLTSTTMRLVSTALRVFGI